MYKNENLDKLIEYINEKVVSNFDEVVESTLDNYVDFAFGNEESDLGLRLNLGLEYISMIDSNEGYRTINTIPNSGNPQNIRPEIGVKARMDIVYNDDNSLVSVVLEGDKLGIDYKLNKDLGVWDEIPETYKNKLDSLKEGDDARKLIDIGYDLYSLQKN